MEIPESEYDYNFVPPPEAPVFTPSMEEFKDCFAYLNKIRPIWEHHGIIKIRPPEEWVPPFSVDIDKLKFNTRIQRLNELDAHTRIKLNFLDKVSKFWELQGSNLKIPIVEKRALDLYTLKKFVIAEGGMDMVNRNNLWARVAADMGYSPVNCTKMGNLLRSHYERILFPLDIFEKEISLTSQNEKKITIENHSLRDGKLPPPADQPLTRQTKYDAMVLSKSRPSKNNSKSRPSRTVNTKSRPSRMMTTSQISPNSQQLEDFPNNFSEELPQLQVTENLQQNLNYDPLEKYLCEKCGRGDSEETLLLCDGCDESFHTQCLTPPLTEIPKGSWRCIKCIYKEVSKPSEGYGFEPSPTEYSLQSFGEMADQFKSDYFNLPVHIIPPSLVEKEYWRILDNIDEDVMVEYGADLHTMDIGSGFPTMKSTKDFTEEEKYINHDWNLNNMPVLSNSILKQIDADITGMKVPWIYVGMCFSTFCWHVEDHWTPSISYMHWGEPKTWYGIPANYAEKAEEVMRNSAKELFTSTPDLLHHIVTTLNPNLLQAHGIPVHRMNQYPGEFIVTAPRGYHAGFNCGYNCAEAVNFALPEWMELGRRCVEHYCQMRRYCVFSHDELVCKMASQAENLTLDVAAAAYNDMLQMVEVEKEHRKQLLFGGVREAEREAFELLPEDERQCAICQTTCFASALVCNVGEEDEKIVCLRHFDEMQVDPSTLVLRYRYTLDELAVMLQVLKIRAESYTIWVEKVRNALAAKGNCRLAFQELKSMYREALIRKYPGSDLIEALQLIVEEGEKCEMVVQKLSNGNLKARTRSVNSGCRISVEELKLFSNQLETLPGKISGNAGFTKLVENVNEFQEEAKKLVESDDVTVEMIEKCLEKAETMDIEFSDIIRLKHKLEEVAWIDELKELMSSPSEVNIESLNRLKESGQLLSWSKGTQAGLETIANLLKTLASWETKAAFCFSTKPKLSLKEVENLVTQGEALSLALPSLPSLKNACRNAKEWIARAKSLQGSHDYPYMNALEKLITRGRELPIYLDSLPELEARVAEAKAWRETTARVFLKKASKDSLLEVLCPRFQFSGMITNELDQFHKNENNFQHHIFQNLSNAQLSDPQKIVDAFRKAEEAELIAIKNRRKEVQKEGTHQCEICREHLQENISFSEAKGGQGESSKSLCRKCIRSRRPRLETILSLLVSLQEVTVRMPEGEALQCLTERAMGWQDRARTLLKSTELSAASRKLSIEGIENLMNNTVFQDTIGDNMKIFEDSDSESEDTFHQKVDLHLSSETISMLEELMLEGNLLEVSLNETKHIRVLLQVDSDASPGRQIKQIFNKQEKVFQTTMAEKKNETEQTQIEDTKEKKYRYKNKNRKREGQVKKKEARKTTSEDDCSASSPRCKRPIGKEVNWVQCDGCHLWFHLYCIGLKPVQISEQDDFICSFCKSGKRKKPV